MKYILFLLFLTTCWNDMDEETYCFECVSSVKNDTTIYCDKTKEEILNLETQNIDDSLTCIIISK